MPVSTMTTLQPSAGTPTMYDSDSAVPSIAVTYDAAAGLRTRRSALQPSETPAKKQSKWTPTEDAIIIGLRGSGMKWDDISKNLPGRSPISCRLHYQNYLERRSEWDEERKNKLARLYERFKAQMWAKVAEELQVPWRAAEAMHWQLGEAEMARRAGVTAFSLQPPTLEALSDTRRQHSPRGQSSRGHVQSQSQGSGFASGPDSPPYGGPFVPSVNNGYPSPGQRLDHSGQAYGQHTAPPPRTSSAGLLAAPRGRLSPPQQHHRSYLFPIPPTAYESHKEPDVGLPPIQPSSHTRDPGVLPGIAQITSGINANSIPAYAASWLYQKGAASPNLLGNPPTPTSSTTYELPLTYPTHSGVTGYSASGKRGPSPEVLEREATRRRYLDQQPRQEYYQDRPGSGSSSGRHV